MPPLGGAFNDLAAVKGGYLVGGAIRQSDFGQHTTTSWLLKTDAFGFAGSCPAQSYSLTVAEIQEPQYEQNFSTTPFSSVEPAVLSSHPDSLSMTLLCEKACPTHLEICNNNLDDDGDGLFDCLDPDCPCSADACEPKRNNRWYFGYHKGLDFSTEPPQVLPDGKTDNGKVSATISDDQGNLLFYTDGFHIFNRFHQIMPNGTNSFQQSFTNATCIIIPFPGDPARYYVFINNQYQHFSYSVVDMHLDMGRGDVVPAEHFILINTTGMQMQGLSATRSCTFNGYWVAVHNHFTNEMVAYRIDQAGLQLTPVISPAGITSFSQTYQIKFSPTGKQLTQMISGDTLVLYTFDPDLSQSGRFTNPQKIRVGQADGVEFSPSGRYLYVRGFPSPGKENLVQFDLEAGNSTAITNSKIEIFSWTNTSDGGLQLAPNGKIYLAQGYPNTTIDVIHRPDAYGSACQYQQAVITLPSQATPSYYGFCNVITSDFRQPHIAFLPDARDSICTLNTPVFYQLKNVGCDVTDIQWSLVGLTGTISPNYQYANITYTAPGEGQLIVTAHTPCGMATDTLAVVVYAPFNKMLDLGPDRTVCDNGVFTFNAGSGFAQYRWQNGSPDSILTTLQPGKYWVDVYDQCGNRQSDTVVVKIAPATKLALGPDRTGCPGLPADFPLPAAFTGWQWSPATFLSCDTCATVTATPAATT
ncbi:MAG: hypothetical protein ABIO24_12470, partial [Saprospiraceae bacterium]